MKNNNENNEELQIAVDGLTQLLEEVKEAVLSQKKDNGSSALTVDLLTKIQQTIDQSKKAIDEEDLKRFLNAVINTLTELQEGANKSFSEYLERKIAQMGEFVKQPTVVRNHYSIDFKSSKMFIAIIFLSLGLFCSLFGNYNQYQENSRLVDNDLKYRFVKMKNGILPNEIPRLENFFFYSDSAYVVNNIRKSVIDYEHRLEEQALRLEQKRQNKETIQRLNKEIEQLK